MELWLEKNGVKNFNKTRKKIELDICSLMILFKTNLEKYLCTKYENQVLWTKLEMYLTNIINFRVYPVQLKALVVSVICMLISFIIRGLFI